MYIKARNGDIKNFTGISSPYENPENPEIHVINDNISVDKASDQIMNFLIKNKYRQLNKGKNEIFYVCWKMAALHKGHLWLINERLKEGKNVWLAIRDVKPDKNNPLTAQEIEKMIHEGELKDLIADGRVVTSIIPDIESVNYGRGVGYEIIEHVPPKDIEEISATRIREDMRTRGEL